jgi:hypothetical protein
VAWECQAPDLGRRSRSGRGISTRSPGFTRIGSPWKSVLPIDAESARSPPRSPSRWFASLAASARFRHLLQRLASGAPASKSIAMSPPRLSDGANSFITRKISRS